MKRFHIPLLLLWASLLSACGGASGITVVDSWARPAEAGQNSAVYFQMHNSSAADDALLSVSGGPARAIEMHMSMAMDMGSDELDGMVDSANGGMAMGDVMQMQPQGRVALPSGESVIFQPGGLHVMLIDLEHALLLGDHFPLTLNFASGLSIELDVEVKTP